MATWQDGPEYAPTARPSAFVEPAAVALDSTPPPVALENGVPGLEPSFVPPEQPTPDLRALVPSAAPGRNPNLPFESATTPLTAVEEAAAPRSPLQPFMTGGPSLAGYLPAQPVVQPTAQVNPVTLPMSMAQQWAPPAPATRVQGSVPVTVRQIWQATTGWVLVPLLIGMFLTPIAPVCLLVAGVSSAQVRHRRAAVRRAFQVAPALSLGASHGARASVFVEYHGTFSDESVPDMHAADGGFTWLLGDDLQLDVSAGAGLDDDAPDFLVSAGVAWRFFLP